MITDHDLAVLCAASYNDDAKWDHEWTASDIYVFHVEVEGTDILVFRGSHNVHDWLVDFDALPHKHPRIGWCHAGFLRYMDLVLEEVMSVIGKDIIVTGHSLGAARASILAGLLIDHGALIRSRVVFGEPKPGFKRLATILQQSGCELRSYRNLQDPVTEVPLTLSLLPYMRASPLIPISVPADDGNDILHEHHIGLYVSGMQTLLKETKS